ncbi:MAG: hypothetical protein RR971_04110 [Alistipes sp.]
MEFSDCIVRKFDKEIKGCRLFPNVVPDTEGLPFAHYSEQIQPVQTKDGIAGYDSTVIITVAASTKSAAQILATKIETIFNSSDVGGRTMWLESIEYTLYEKENINTYELNFNLI